jgi:hypothetical protein
MRFTITHDQERIILGEMFLVSALWLTSSFFNKPARDRSTSNTFLPRPHSKLECDADRWNQRQELLGSPAILPHILPTQQIQDFP